MNNQSKLNPNLKKMVFCYLQTQAFVAWQLKIIVFTPPPFTGLGGTLNPLHPLYTPLRPFKVSSFVGNTLIHNNDK